MCRTACSITALPMRLPLLYLPRRKYPTCAHETKQMHLGEAFDTRNLAPAAHAAQAPQEPRTLRVQIQGFTISP